MFMTDYRHRTIDVDGTDLHVVEAGDAEDPPVVLLHGFPEFWYGWRRQIEPLSRAGYRVLAVDQRGYNESDRPAEIDAYRLDRLAGDIAGLCEALSLEPVRLVGHDWGGAVTWWLAMTRPDILEEVAILNSPHPQVFQKHLTSRTTQLLKSWYMFFFQLPFVPERVLGTARGAVVARALEKTSRVGAFSAEDLDEYREAWAKPGAWRGMLNWYRAAARTEPDPPDSTTVDVPTLILWGDRDSFLAPELADASIERCRDGRLERFPDATHWLQHEYAAAINRELVQFFDA
jgi:pimeloyl-ACP methyl ester carboxylesterase